MAAYYISPTGNDTTGNGSSATPWQTVSKAFSSSVSGDTIYCKDGTYTWVTQAFTSVRTITAVNYGSAIFDAGSVNVPWNAGQDIAMVCNGIVFQNNTANLGSGQNVWLANAGGSNLSSWTFNSCTLKNITCQGTLGNPCGIFGQSNTNWTSYYYFNSCLIQSLTGVVTNSQWGCSNGSNWQFTNCTIYFPATHNMLQLVKTTFNAPNSQTVIFKNCIVYNAGGSINLNSSNANCTYSDMFGTYTNSGSGGTGDITSDPLFVDVGNLNFNLRPTSPCLDTGTLN